MGRGRYAQRVVQPAVQLGGVGVDDSTVIVYDYQTSSVRHELKHDGGVIKLAWHPNGIVLVTGCLDGCVYLWNGRDGSLIHKMNGHTVGDVGRDDG